MSAPVPTILFLCSGNYYRSRFAEHLFNHLAPAAALPHRAESAGLWPNCRTHNSGPISEFTVAALRERGVSLPREHRVPRDVTEADLRRAARTIALKEAEHRPIVLARFPAFVEQVEYWHVDDVPQALPHVALPLIETKVRALVAALAANPAG